MTNKIDSVMRETRQYWYADGFVELTIGLLFSVLGIGVYLQYLALGNPSWLIANVIGLTLFIAGSSFGVKWLVTTLKERVTYPRTGYVEFNAKPNPTIRRIVMAFPLLIGAGILFLPQVFDVMGATVGLLLAVILMFFAYQSGTWRFTVASIIAIVAGIGSSYLAMNDIVSVAIVFGIVGVSLLTSGWIVCMKYLNNNPPADDAS